MRTFITSTNNRRFNRKLAPTHREIGLNLDTFTAGQLRIPIIHPGTLHPIWSISIPSSLILSLSMTDPNPGSNLRSSYQDMSNRNPLPPLPSAHNADHRSPQYSSIIQDSEQDRYPPMLPLFPFNRVTSILKFTIAPLRESGYMPISTIYSMAPKKSRGRLCWNYLVVP